MSPKSPRKNFPGYTVEQKTNCGEIYVIVNYDPATKAVQEVIIRFGKAGGCGSAMGDVIAKLISYGLRSGMEIGDAIKALEGNACHLGKETCFHNVAKAIRYVETALRTGQNINDVIDAIESGETGEYAEAA